MAAQAQPKWVHYLAAVCLMCCVVPCCWWCLTVSICGWGIPKDAKEAGKQLVCANGMSMVGNIIKFLGYAAGCYYIYTVWQRPGTNLKVN